MHCRSLAGCAKQDSRSDRKVIKASFAVQASPVYTFKKLRMFHFSECRGDTALPMQSQKQGSDTVAVEWSCEHAGMDLIQLRLIICSLGIRW